MVELPLRKVQLNVLIKNVIPWNCPQCKTNLKAVAKHWGCAVSRGKWLIYLKMLAIGWADFLSLQCFKVNYHFQMYLLEVFPLSITFWCIQRYDSSVEFLYQGREHDYWNWMRWALCPNEPVYSWLVFVISYLYIKPDMVQAMWPFTTQRWRLSPTGAAAVVPAVLMHGLLTAGAS